MNGSILFSIKLSALLNMDCVPSCDSDLSQSDCTDQSNCDSDPAHQTAPTSQIVIQTSAHQTAPTSQIVKCALINQSDR